MAQTRRDTPKWNRPRFLRAEVFALPISAMARPRAFFITNTDVLTTPFSSPITNHQSPITDY